MKTYWMNTRTLAWGEARDTYYQISPSAGVIYAVDKPSYDLLRAGAEMLAVAVENFENSESGSSAHYEAWEKMNDVLASFRDSFPKEGK